MEKKDIIILGIESSCDETSVAVVKNGREVLSMVTNTQIDIHKLYGGVLPVNRFQSIRSQKFIGLAEVFTSEKSTICR